MSNQNLLTNWQECIFCSNPADIKEIKGRRTTFECSVCEREFSIEDPDPEIAKIINENFFDLL